MYKVKVIWLESMSMLDLFPMEREEYVGTFDSSQEAEAFVVREYGSYALHNHSNWDYVASITKVA